MEKVFVGIGSNLGEAKKQVETAISRLSKAAGIHLVRTASLYGSKPFGPIEQNDFVNTVVEIECALEPLELLELLKQVEQELGRVRSVRWGPREIDLDILIFGTRELSSDHLSLPHPGISERAFVLVPLAELEPELILPHGVAIGDALRRLDKGSVWLL